MSTDVPNASGTFDPRDPQMLMAYADGELVAADAARVEAAMARDPALARIVDAHRALQAQLAGAFSGVLAEPVPARLQATLHAAARDPRRLRSSAPRWTRREWLAMAASLLVGIALALALPRSGLRRHDAGGAAPMLVDADFVARGALARALDAQLSGAASADVQPELSFRAQDGRYCRSFRVHAARPLAGLACRDGAVWRVSTLATAVDVGTGAMRQAGSTLPPAVLADIDAHIDGQALDADGERKARAHGWR